MKHARADYKRIQDPSGKIPDDEPVLLLRAQDCFAGVTLRFYAARLEAGFGDPKMVEMVRRHADLMDAWPFKKTPDLP